ncbi:hypothetical protein HPC37_02950 [Pasteurellaceae bacterium 20609_3]|uniref:hypothetical protein n=1 Tax=Spirabiliibacterium mucosae TaxID=28156 RepID=UPI001AADD02A|nr:hypothetical protein [Spirabiliibacterium mucosae]MBE2897813.1 hypothetical protein [Spirabiliibacterium mucosae]
MKYRTNTIVRLRSGARAFIAEKATYSTNYPLKGHILDERQTPMLWTLDGKNVYDDDAPDPFDIVAVISNASDNLLKDFIHLGTVNGKRPFFIRPDDIESIAGDVVTSRSGIKYYPITLSEEVKQWLIRH